MTGEEKPEEIQKEAQTLAEEEQQAPTGPTVPAAPGLYDSGWSDKDWSVLLKSLVDRGILTWKEIAALVIGHLNPSQVGTSLASSEGFKRKYGKGNTMRLVLEWVYEQTGRCADCGSRLELQADHVKGREAFDDPLDADFIENMTLRCRRCNVIRRPSHELGGLTYLTAEAALMWILFVIKPRTFRDFVRLCRLYGMTMSDIRMAEAWAMAHWLRRAEPPAYSIDDDDDTKYDLIMWPDGAITRVDVGLPTQQEAQRLYAGVPRKAVLGFLTEQMDGRIKFHEQHISSLPFSTYDLGSLPPQALAVQYAPPDRKKKRPQKLTALAPRGLKLLAHAVRDEDQRFFLYDETGATAPQELTGAPSYGRLVKTNVSPANCRLRAGAPSS